ncbi:MAG: MBL fold metallo-hydrolase [Candidatus Thermoplasmatota archaeon]
MSEVAVHTVTGRGYSSNVFLVESEKDFLVDAGMGNSDRIMDLAEEVSVKLDRLILTHRHVDHVGDARELSEGLNVPLYAPEKEAEALRSGDDRTVLGSNFGKKIPPLDVKTLDEDEYSNFRILHTPGHTEGSISLYHPNENILLSGDTVFSHGSVGRTDLPTGDKNELLESVERLSELEVDSLYPGHMSAVEKGGSDHIKRALDHLRMF